MPDEGLVLAQSRLETLRREHALTDAEYAQCERQLMSVKDADALVATVLKSR